MIDFLVYIFPILIAITCIKIIFDGDEHTH